MASYDDRERMTREHKLSERRMNNYFYPRRISIALTLLLTAFSISYSQTPPSSDDRDNARTMLSTVKSDLQKYYYDPQFHGMNLEERFKTAEEKINQATSLAQLLGVIGQVLLDLNDSHTIFLPPGRTYKTDYGWQMKAIGDRCYVVAVKPQSDAEAKGLQEGDEIVSIDGLKPRGTMSGRFFISTTRFVRARV